MNKFNPHTLPNIYTNDFLLSINPYIRRAWYSILPPGFQIPERVIFDYEIVLIKDGRAQITVEDESYEAKCGDIFFFRPGQRHSFKVYDQELVQPHVHFDLIYQNGLSENIPISKQNMEEMDEDQRRMIEKDITCHLFENFPCYIQLNNPTIVEQLLFDVIDAYDRPGPFPEIRLKWKFLHLLEYLLSEIALLTVKRTPQKKEWAEEFRLYLESNIDRTITLNELSEVFHIDRSYISRIFTTAYNTPPIRYHTMLRVERAKRMILYTNLSLTDIAEQTGFPCLQDFSRIFRRLEGVSPSKLRK